MLTGRALHTGVPSTVTVTPRPDDGLGIRLWFPGFGEPLTAGALSALTRTARRATVLRHPETGAVIRTPEHLLAAVLFFADAPIDVACDAEELPGLDGSAAMYYGLLHALCIANEYPDARAKQYASGLEWEYDGPEGTLRALPQDFFSVEYFWESGAVRQHFELSSALDAPDEVLPARTFILYHDWMKLSGGSDLLAGADLDSGLLIATSKEQFAEGKKKLPQSCGNEFPLLHPVRFRMNDELARHKVLDLLGDLALNGLALPKLRLTITNGGHALNHLLLDALQYQDAGRETTKTEGTAP